MIQLHRGDCLQFLPTLPAGSVDAVVTDPPYNVGLHYASTDDDRADYADWCAAWFAQLQRVTAGPILISCGIGKLGMWHQIERPRWVLCWWKPASMGRSPVGFNNWEPILLYGKALKPKGCDVIRACIRPDHQLDGHPCPKPVEWARKQAEWFVRPGATILDPFMGSGTTGVACAQTGRRFIGCEIDPGYFKIAKRRIAEAQRAALVPA